MLNDVFIKVVGHSIVLIGRGLGTSKGRKLNKEAIVPISLSLRPSPVCLSVYHSEAQGHECTVGRRFW